ncbi:hypothetical protein FH972_025120 [Carpinus fangiana]|uniref:NAD(P)-binding protein n=1 Tax=Carpinus fangiana TaxID=176857 RepID=A0A5N6L0G6_9ROSI|nr:hypothetical protein FH972_025120 [Carpinus fangiana]
MSAPKTILITGANRGLGKGLVETYLARPNHTVIAGSRDPSNESTKALSKVPKAQGSTLIVVKIDSTAAEDAAEAVKELQQTHGIEKLDVVVANAGIAEGFPKVSELDVQLLQKHFVTNVHGVIWLFQAVLPLLNKSSTPKFVTIGSLAGQFGETASPIPISAYGSSKALLHFYTLQIHHEEPQLTAFPLHPGWVQTDMGNKGAEVMGLEKAGITTEESVTGMVKVLDAATRETHGGKLWYWDGSKQPWNPSMRNKRVHVSNDMQGRRDDIDNGMDRGKRETAAINRSVTRLPRYGGRSNATIVALAPADSSALGHNDKSHGKIFNSLTTMQRFEKQEQVSESLTIPGQKARG